MQSKWTAIIVTLLGILLLLPKLGVTLFGDLTSGLMSWAIPILILIVGIIRIGKAYGK